MINSAIIILKNVDEYPLMQTMGLPKIALFWDFIDTVTVS